MIFLAALDEISSHLSLDDQTRPAQTSLEVVRHQNHGNASWIAANACANNPPGVLNRSRTAAHCPSAPLLDLFGTFGGGQQRDLHAGFHLQQYKCCECAGRVAWCITAMAVSFQHTSTLFLWCKTSSFIFVGAAEKKTLLHFPP
jgi:hypothetical protein